jgi:hypothetical protein
MMRRILAVGVAVVACTAITACLVGAAQSFAKPAVKHAHAAKQHNAKKKRAPAKKPHRSSVPLGRSADLTAEILLDCSYSRSGFLTHRYSARALVLAQRQIPGDIANYTSCPDAIHRQLVRSTARLSVSLHRTRRAPASAARIVVTGLDRHVADARVVGSRQAADFALLPGVYKVAAAGHPGCSRQVRASEWRTTSVRLVCAR